MPKQKKQNYPFKRQGPKKKTISNRTVNKRASLHRTNTIKSVLRNPLLNAKITKYLPHNRDKKAVRIVGGIKPTKKQKTQIKVNSLSNRAGTFAKRYLHNHQSYMRLRNFRYDAHKYNQDDHDYDNFTRRYYRRGG